MNKFEKLSQIINTFFKVNNITISECKLPTTDSEFMEFCVEFKKLYNGMLYCFDIKELSRADYSFIVNNSLAE